MLLRITAAEGSLRRPLDCYPAGHLGDWRVHHDGSQTILYPSLPLLAWTSHRKPDVHGAPVSLVLCRVQCWATLLQLSCPEPWGQAGQESPSSFCKWGRSSNRPGARLGTRHGRNWLWVLCPHWFCFLPCDFTALQKAIAIMLCGPPEICPSVSWLRHTVL